MSHIPWNAVVVIGFERTMYNTPENDSVRVMVCASVRPPPSLAKTVEVLLTSMDGTAMGKSRLQLARAAQICHNLATCLPEQTLEWIYTKIRMIIFVSFL